MDFSNLNSRSALLEQAIRFLMELGEAERAVVLSSFETEDGLPAVKAVYGFEPEEVWSGQVASRSVFKKVLRDGKSLLAADARQDVMLGGRRSVMAAELVSILAVPYRNHKDEVAGLLYADARMKVASFDYSHLKDTEEFAEAFGRRWFELPADEDQSLLPPRPGQRKPQRPRQEVAPGPLPPNPGTPPGVWIALVALVLLFLMCTGPSVKSPAPTPTVAATAALPDLEERPYGLARSFLDDVQNGRAEQAHKLLSGRLAGELRPGDLKRMGNHWKEIDMGLERRILSERIANNAAAIEVGRPGAPSTTWYFVKEGSGWKLDRLDPEA